ncbi:MAG: mannose-1-phosphate guanylyltransferase/mannose-6-phosphate isomerase [Halieaceae bacterium]|nr:mannose-1-phosphate guanylyltransferase/mannose-6-phosphate isomerase [Halieaceae bacterium]
MLVPVLLAGGVGSRLWPVSREAYPKQFLPLSSEDSMLVDTFKRLEGVTREPPAVICNDAHRFIVAEQLRDQSRQGASIILEPLGRNTAPAVAVAAMLALQKSPDALLLVLPADHLIADVAAFRTAVGHAVEQANAGKLVTFGVVANRAETGYGYIRRGDALDSNSFTIGEFVEKPDAETAQAYLDSGDYYWNSGMFLLGAATYMEELEQFAPEIVAACKASLEGAAADLDFVRLDRASFEACPSDSIDYAVMEKTRRGAVVPLDCGWSDVGAWSAVWEAGDADTSGNVVQGDVLLDDTQNSFIRSESRLVATTGVRDVVVVETKDAVLVAHRDRVQNVKNLVNALNAADREESRLHARVYRPWGSYESLINGDRFQVKRIVVNPGQKLSLQKHHHRAEHWIVVNGTAEVTCEDKVFMLGEDESTYIPLGHKHRLVNPGRIPLELIEVQSGGYLGEDDIVRYDDIYGRSEEKQ